MKRNKYLILNYIFVACIFILCINDHFLKYEFSNGFTGKISDVAGIIVLPLLLSFIFPKLKLHSLWISMLIFTFWKSPYSDGFIELYNRFALIRIVRVVDYTDLFVFIFLSVPYCIIRKVDDLKAFYIQKLHPLFILFPTTFILMATSPPPSYSYTLSRQNLYCMKCHITVSLSQNEIVNELKKDGIVFDTFFPVNEKVYEQYPDFRKNDIHFYHINHLVIEKDTLKNVEFAMRSIGKQKTKFYFNGMHTNNDISTLKLFSKVRKKYKRLVLKELKNSLKD